MYWARGQTVRLGTRQEWVGSLLRVSRASLDGAREFAKRRLRLAGRLLGVAERFTRRRFAEGIGKLARNTSGDRRRKTGDSLLEIPKVAGMRE
ncbi:hypothetical protein BHM03_00056929 [Ensete ventricosum]|nr:hypothetical protein BHM03_00056929 [Ensete ventricosum]